MNVEMAAHSRTVEKTECNAVRNTENITNCSLIFMLFAPFCIYTHPITLNSLAKVVSLNPRVTCISFLYKPLSGRIVTSRLNILYI